MSVEEQINLREAVTESLKESSSMQVLAHTQAAVSSSSGGAPLSSEERAQYEQEKIKLYEQLDEKDDEIQARTAEVQSYKEQVVDQDELYQATKRDNDALQAEINRIQAENESTKVLLTLDPHQICVIFCHMT